MNKHNAPSGHDMVSLADEAKNLMSATAEVAGEKVGQARKRLVVMLEGTKDRVIQIRNKAVSGAKATDRAIHKHPYKSIAVMLGVGALIGVVLARRAVRKET